MNEITYIVYVQTNTGGGITAINSSAFVDGTGWAQIDQGSGDRYHHAQNHYLDGPLFDRGVPRYKLTDGIATLRPQTEIDEDIAAIPAPVDPVAAMRADVDYLLIAEMQREGLL